MRNVEHINIAIDGPAGAGKSTVAKRIADRLGIRYLDTGAMYRALALGVLRAGVDTGDEAAVSAMLPGLDIRVTYDARGQRVLLNGDDVTAGLRTPEITMAASAVGKLPCVRHKLVELQQAAARSYSMVMDGRDITTVVLPDTPYKFFVTASPEVRAERRLLEMRQKGDDSAAYADVLRDIRRRDEQDSTRECMPLRVADDAVVVDTSALSVDTVVEGMLRSIEQKRSCRE